MLKPLRAKKKSIMKRIIKRFLILFDIRSCIICGKYRYKAPYTLSGGGVLCKQCLRGDK